MRILLACSLFTGVACAQLAWAQSALPERLYLDTGALLGSNRMVGLGGAYAGIAEGADGLTSNLASVAHREKTLDRRWDLDATFSLMSLPIGSPGYGRDPCRDGGFRRKLW